MRVQQVATLPLLQPTYYGKDGNNGIDGSNGNNGNNGNNGKDGNNTFLCEVMVATHQLHARDKL